MAPKAPTPSLFPISAALGGLVTLGAAIGIGRFIYTPILPLMVEGLGLSKFTAGAIASANFAGYLAGALLAAWRLPGSRHGWLLGALLASGLSTGAMGFSTSVPLFFALRFAGGVASALALILVSATVLDVLAEAGRPNLSALMFAGVGAGIAASAALVAGLRSGGFGWAALWIAGGAVSLAGTFAVALLLPRGRRGAAAGSVANRAENGSALARLVAAYGLFGFGYVITATFIVAIVRAEPGLRAAEPAIWAVFGLAAAPSVALWAAIARPIGLPRAFALACVVEAIGVLVSVAWHGMAGVFLASLLVGGTFMGLTALGLVRGRSFRAGDGRRVLALMTSAFGLGQIVGPSFAGMLYDRTGGLGVPSVVAAGALAAAAVLARK